MIFVHWCLQIFFISKLFKINKNVDKSNKRKMKDVEIRQNNHHDILIQNVNNYIREINFV